jgi:ATP-binding cassette subfamily B protein
MKENSLYKNLFQLTKPYKWGFISAMVLAVVLSIMTPLRPYMIQQTIDKDLFGHQEQYLTRDCLLMFGLLILESILRYYFIYLTASMSQGIVHTLRRRVYDFIQQMNVSFYDKTPIGVLTTRTINDVETIQDVFSENLFTILSDLITIVAVLCFMFYTDVELSLVSLLTLPFLFWATYIFKEKNKTVFQKIRQKIADLNAFAQEHITGIRLIKAFNAESIEMKKFDQLNEEYTKENMKSIMYFSWFFPVLDSLIMVSIGLLVACAAYKATTDKTFSVGLISAFILYLNILFRPLRFLADKFNTLQMGFVASERVFKLIQSEDLETNTGSYRPTHVEGTIRFENVCFEYKEGVPILKHINFEIPKGQSLAIVGATGSGKTTIIQLLNRFYKIKSGHITLDQHDLYDYDLDFLRSQIAMVLQEVFLFSGSIMDNILLYNESIDHSKVVEICKELEIDDFINRLPGGYDYPVMERGNSLSHGQRQLISFIRAILKNPNILILDEATSSIDSNTEHFIQKLIPKMIQGKTSIIIAHRLSTIVQADKIIVMDQGEIVGEGTHDSLLKTNAYYQKYFKKLEKEQ